MLGTCYFIMVFIELAMGCGGGGGGGYYYYPPSYTDDDPLTSAEKGLYGSFQLPKSVRDKWTTFLLKYQADQDITNNRTLTDQDRLNDGRLPQFGWPPSWKGLGWGDAGLKEIPPWGWEPVNDENLPTYCFLPLDLGNDTGIGDEVCEAEDRYAHNPFIKNCVSFKYLGCAGNTNNFVSMELCTEQCMPHPKQGGCDPNLKQFISTLSDLDEEWGEGDEEDKR